MSDFGSEVPTSAAPTGLTAGDLDGDVDLITVLGTIDWLGISLNAGDGTFGAVTLLATGG